MGQALRRVSRGVAGGFGAGVGAALVMLVVMALLRFTTNTVSLPELMEQGMITIVGGPVEAFFINTLGVGGKALLIVTVVEGTLLLGGLLGWSYARFWPSGRARNALSGIVYGLAIGLLLNVLFLPLFDQGFFGSSATGVTAPPDIAQALYGSTLAPFGLPVWVEMFLVSLVFGLTLVKLLPRAQAADAESEAAATEKTADAAPESRSRRDFMKALGGGAVALAGGAALWGVLVKALAPPPGSALVEIDPSAPDGAAGQPSPTGVAGGAPTGTVAAPTSQVAQAGPTATGFAGVKPKLVPEITATDDFYITTKNLIDPTVDGAGWKLSFKGLVDNPYTITLADLKVMSSSNRTETLECISNPVGGPLISNATWKGVSFADLLNRAGPKPGAVDVIVRAADGYSDSFPVGVALNNDCLLAYEMNGAQLTQKHGYPARLLVPGIFGMKNCKWITEVEVSASDYRGYWEMQGWSDTAPYLTMSRIDSPDGYNLPAKPVYIGGVAFAGNRGIKRVEVSTDAGVTWHDAELRKPLGPYTWVQWYYPWLPEKGSHVLTVRATDGTGAVQTAEQADTYPDGATGYHTRVINVS